MKGKRNSHSGTTEQRQGSHQLFTDQVITRRRMGGASAPVFPAPQARGLFRAERAEVARPNLRTGREYQSATRRIITVETSV